ncbi:SIR2 family protein [Desulforhabdus sp. TSK]|uniref:SIR2 family NAD-dependent protein deacylase n=1 Tax=Desulforhabdus sp. TSK TaxID=2925014 RepID=UPI001FC89F93|nr:SIR2 family protein [Desulforhabdus sp. TSK]GKT07138.1 hypothetical protein DSTSK_04430 [Desulforhabdus sp. TSK]
MPKDPLLRGQITCEAMRWDDPNAPVTMPATLTPQEAVNQGLAKPSECDAVIVILWSRLGTPLPDTYKRPDGSPYLLGTEWEYEDAFAAKPPPYVLVYHRKSKVDFGDPSEPAFDEKVQQFRRVQKFFERFRNADGSLKGGFVDYDTPQEFRDHLRLDLRAFIERRLAEKKTEARATRIKAPPPYSVIAKALSGGRVVPIIGAGISHSGRPADAHWNPQAPEFLPSGVELSHFLADDTGFPSEEERSQLAEVASYYEAFQTRATLRERLRQVLGPGALAGASIPSLYQFLAEAPRPLLIVTANYDTQIERAFYAARKPYDLVVYTADRKDLANAVLWWPHGAALPETPAPNALDIDLETTTVIFKMHGSILPETDEWDSFVITETDYVELLSRMASRSAIPALFATHCRDRNLLFLVYSLRDWNFRTILQSLNRFFAKRVANYGEEEIPSWAIDEHLSELETKFWQKRGVYPYEISIDEFVTTLRARMPA